ncbi:MAG: hypothetical protein K1X83_06760 [Oligoflexia bacterium]|nr:hypothetical protein [Oligoflexia bacterium]
MTTADLDRRVLPKDKEVSAHLESRNDSIHRSTISGERPAEPFETITLPPLARGSESRLLARFTALPAQSDHSAVAEHHRAPAPGIEKSPQTFSAWLEAGSRLISRASDGIRKNIVEPIATALENLREGTEQFLRHPIATTQQLAARCQNWWKDTVSPAWERLAERCQRSWNDLSTAVAHAAQQASDNFAKLVESLSKTSAEPALAAKQDLTGAAQLLASHSSYSAQISDSKLFTSLSEAVCCVAPLQQQKLAEILVELGEALGKENERNEKKEEEAREEIAEHTHDVVEELYALRSDPRFQPAIDHVIAILRDIIPNYGDLACAGALLAEIDAHKEAQAA